MDTVVIYVEFLVLTKKHSLLFQFTFSQGIFRTVAEHMFELKYVVARNDRPDTEPKRKIQLFLGAKPNIQPV